MVVYQASEKDCVGEDGSPQECVICFEEFEPGVGMGRLECLCKFHKVGQIHCPDLNLSGASHSVLYLVLSSTSTISLLRFTRSFLQFSFVHFFQAASALPFQ